MKIISDPHRLEPAWSQQYDRVSHYFSRILPKQGGVMVEIGCGKGQLTIPLAERLPQFQIIAVDRFKGPYSESRTELLTALASRGKKIGVKIVVSDYQTWLASQPESKYEAIISSEFLPEIDSKGMRRFLSECYRVLRPGGATVHSFLSAVPRNARQQRVIEADADPRWTKTPPTEWFSPPERLIQDYLGQAGFSRLRRVRLRSGLVIRSEAAKQVLSDWDVRESYWRAHREELVRQGLEIPDWMIISGTKAVP